MKHFVLKLKYYLSAALEKFKDTGKESIRIFYILSRGNSIY